MRTVSTDFQTEIVAQDKARDVYGKIIVNITDPTVIPDDVTSVTMTTGSTDTISSTLYATDGVDTAYNYASLETDRWDLTKGFKLLPDSAPYENMGWWSSADPETLMSDEDGIFTPYQVMLITLGAEHDSAGLTIFFDTNNEEYAVAFNISFLDASSVEVDSVNVTDNNTSRYVYATPIVGYKFIEISIYIWSVVGRRARIAEVFSGIVKEFSKLNPVNRLIDFKILEEIDMLSAVVPSNSLSFTFDNTDDGVNLVYDFFDPTGVFTYLKKNQKIETYLGVMLEDGTIEYVSMGVYYLDKWISDPNGLTATFSGYDRLALFDKVKFYNGVAKASSTANLKGLADDIFFALGVPSSEYSIDVALNSATYYYTVPLPVCTCREALQYVAIAGQCVVYVDRDNIVQIKQLTGVATSKTIGLTNAFRQPEVNFDDVFLKADVEMQQYSIATSATDVYKRTLNMPTVGVNIVRIDFNYQISTISDNTVTITGTNYTSSVPTWTSNVLYLAITMGAGVDREVEITVNAKILTIEKSIFTIDAVDTEGTKELTVKSPLVNSYESASLVADWVALWATKRTNVRLDWRMNPALELGDFVAVEHSFGTLSSTYIVKQEFDYTGGLSGSTYVKK